MTKLRPKDLAGLLLELTDKELHNSKPILSEFVALVAKKRMLGKMSEIISEYTKLYNQKHKIIEAHVSVTSRSEKHFETKLRSALREKYKVDAVEIVEKVDQRLIGGMKVRVGDMVYDASLKNTLNQLEAKLTA